ncbi:hypothetical protein ACFCWG_35275 [Streptomyces sp. NPDC056390]
MPPSENADRRAPTVTETSAHLPGSEEAAVLARLAETVKVADRP